VGELVMAALELPTAKRITGPPDAGDRLEEVAVADCPVVVPPPMGSTVNVVGMPDTSTTVASTAPVYEVENATEMVVPEPLLLAPAHISASRPTGEVNLESQTLLHVTPPPVTLLMVGPDPRLSSKKRVFPAPGVGIVIVLVAPPPFGSTFGV